EVFLAQFSSAGSLNSATYYGEWLDDVGSGVTASSANIVYITGLTTNTTGISTSGAYHPSFGGTNDAFVAKFDFCSGATATTGSPRTICGGVSTTIGTTAVSGNTYSWTSNPVGFTSTLANPTVNPLKTTTYTLIE